MSRRYSSSYKSNHNFSQVPDARIQRSTFDRSHGHKTTFSAGLLTPIYVDEALPGDTHKMKMTAFFRVATPLKPIMDNIILESFFFAVPNRLLWDNWEKFMGSQDNPGDSTDFTIPKLTGATPCAEGELMYYMGIPLGYPYANEDISALPLRAYRMIYNDWFRDENLQDSLVNDKDDGPDSASNWRPFRRGKRKDYFTGALPWPQKGAAVDIPLGTTAPIVPAGTGVPDFNLGGSISALKNGSGAEDQRVQWASDVPDNFSPAAWNDPALEADLTNATAATINGLREAFQIQRLLERDARGGTRYIETIRAHFNVTSPDYRLQRPEYLGGGRSYINFQPVAQTTPDFTDTTPQGNLAAFGTGVIMNHGFTQSFTEHMTIIGIICARADLTYQQGINKMFLRDTRYDFFWPALAHLGEQEILSKELYADGTADDNTVFGWQERYAEYRYKPSLITGRFNSKAAQPIDIWHLAQEFETRPVLNAEFISENVPMARIKAVTDEPDFIGDIQFNLISARPMPVYGVPGYIDHF